MRTTHFNEVESWLYDPIRRLFKKTKNLSKTRRIGDSYRTHKKPFTQTYYFSPQFWVFFRSDWDQTPGEGPKK